ncbi:MAG: formylglycine-generating enzyme family protein [Deltaproteobacteria bacterium]|nr:formylglycine-generating enzyme family protein [Deltaproteobacteria bacterium]
MIALFCLASAKAPPLGAQAFENSLGMEFVQVEAGSFMMGEGPGATAFSDPDEHPRHRVAVAKPFLIARREVTQAQWEAVMGTNPSYFRGPDLPVEQVSWLDAVEFLRRLDRLEGGGNLYRLPTEAEWEYVAREGWHGFFFFGDLPGNLPRFGWTAANSGNTTHPVGALAPSGRGIFDIHGNIAEWTSDWYSADYYSASPYLDPLGPSMGTAKSVRGCAWSDPAHKCRSAYRNFLSPYDRNSHIGFRAVREPERYRVKRKGR